MLTQRHTETKASWNLATQAHNQHKGDQAAFLRNGGDTLFPEELALLGSLEAKHLLHIQCNSGQDSLCLARRGAKVTGIDFSDEAIAYAKRLSAESGISAEFVETEANAWLESTHQRFDIAFASYGVIYWHQDLDRWFRGVHRVLKPGGTLILVEFHPVIYSIGPDLRLSKDDYFAIGPFSDPVGDYVGDSQHGLLHGAQEPKPSAQPFVNPHPAHSYQHTLGSIVTETVQTGFRLQQLKEWPYSNGWRANPALVADGRRWVWPSGAAPVPLMFGLVAQR